MEVVLHDYHKKCVICNEKLIKYNIMHFHCLHKIHFKCFIKIHSKILNCPICDRIYFITQFHLPTFKNMRQLYKLIISKELNKCKSKALLYNKRCSFYEYPGNNGYCKTHNNFNISDDELLVIFKFILNYCSDFNNIKKKCAMYNLFLLVFKNKLLKENTYLYLHESFENTLTNTNTKITSMTDLYNKYGFTYYM